MRVSLKIQQGPRTGQGFEFTEPDTLLVGRSSQAHLILDKGDQFVSRRHFLLEIVPPNCFIKDIGSLNGTFVNGKLTQNAQLKNGDQIKIGKTIIQINIDIEKETFLNLSEIEEIASLKVVISDSNPKFPATCCNCQKDLSTCANLDGRAEEFKDEALYLCMTCASKRQEPVDLQEIGGYKILQELGRGGMGAVYAAIHQSTSRFVALKKIIIPEAPEKLRRRFNREMSIMQRLMHPHIVRLFDVGLHHGENFLVSELLQGGDAHQLMRSKFQGHLDPAVACRLIVDVLIGLEYLHQSGNVHRDIKPKNILLTKEVNGSFGRAKLADFGLAKCYAEAGGATLTEPGEIAGTLLYMAPEQILDFKNVPPIADIYSVGVSLYELLTGKLPFNFLSQFELMKANNEKRHVKDPILIILTEQPIPIKSRNPNIPQALAQIVDKAIRKKKQHRFTSAADFREEIEKVAKSL